MKGCKTPRNSDQTEILCLQLTVTSFQGHAGRDAVNDDDADDVATVVLDEALELLDLLLNRAPDVLLALGFHVDIWSFDA